MHHHLLNLALALIATLILNRPVQAAEWIMPRTEHGHPDLQGFWTNTTQTPIERPAHLGTQHAWTEAEALALEALALQADQEKALPLDGDRGAPRTGDSVGQEADINFIDSYINVLRVKGEYRTSMIVDPPDGRFPFTADAREHGLIAGWRAAGFGAIDGPEMRPPAERCLSRGIPPMVVPPYNANYQIVQTRDYVMILGEMINDARIIRLNGQHFPGEIKTWLGDSIGHWEGDALIVQTIDFRQEISHHRLLSTDLMTLSERFEIVGENEIFYSFKVTDPAIYTRPFTEEMTLRRHGPGEHLYEYSCHEGNYSLPGILAGARRQEQDALELVRQQPSVEGN
jgi:hypothetical protein